MVRRRSNVARARTHRPLAVQQSSVGRSRRSMLSPIVRADRKARRAPSFRAGDQSASAEGAFHTEGLKPVDALVSPDLCLASALLLSSSNCRCGPRRQTRERARSCWTQPATSAMPCSAKGCAGTQAFLRAASDGFEPARGRGFPLPHVTLGVRAGRSNNGAKCTREAGNAVAVAHLAAARVPQSSAAATQAPRFSEGQLHVAAMVHCSMP
jgi:hypothetical protein